jgi:hypothetical protein
MAAATTAATAASAVPPTPVPTAVDQAAMVEIPDDDALPPGWGQWENWLAPAPEPAAGVLVMQEDGCVMPRRPTHDAETSSKIPPWCAWSRSGSPAARRWPTSTRPRPSRRRGSNFGTTGPRSTTR